MKFLRNVFAEAHEQTLKQTCVELGLRYEIRFLEVGNLAMLQNYVKKQGGQDYKQIHHDTLSLFD